jgi:hypothetical protein
MRRKEREKKKEKKREDERKGRGVKLRSEGCLEVLERC